MEWRVMKLRNAMRTAVAGVVLLAGLAVAPASAHAGSSCKGYVCVQAVDGGAYYSYQVRFQRNGYKDGSIYGHADVTGPGGFAAKVPLTGETTFWDGLWSAKQWAPDRGSGNVCATLWKYNGFNNYTNMGSVCTWLWA